MNADIFETYESRVRSYGRLFPAIFHRAKGSLLYTADGQAYIDFLSGAGALNYGHTNDFLKEQILAYLRDDGLMHGLDMQTVAKGEFLEAFVHLIFLPRHLHYKIQFCGPTGTNAVEAALKLARKATGRSNVFAFMGSYHGMSLGSLSASGNLRSRAGAGVPLGQVTFLPYPGWMPHLDTMRYMESVLTDPYSGVEKPAAVVVETVQAEGGVMVAPAEWLRQLRRLCDEHHMVLICDDIQVGCGRTGPFFSFERAGITPDIITLSKSISGYGFPMSLVLIKPELDVWEPGEHSGTFRGNQLAFVAAKAALELRETLDLEPEVFRKGAWIEASVREMIEGVNLPLALRGIGMIWGVDVSGCGMPGLARRVAKRCFELGLIIECVGRDDSVLKILPPLTIEQEHLERGCAILRQSIQEHL